MCGLHLAEYRIGPATRAVRRGAERLLASGPGARGKPSKRAAAHLSVVCERQFAIVTLRACAATPARGPPGSLRTPPGCPVSPSGSTATRGKQGEPKRLIRPSATAETMALVIRDAWSGQPTHAIYVRHAHILKPLFHSDLKQALLHSTFRR